MRPNTSLGKNSSSMAAGQATKTTFHASHSERNRTGPGGRTSPGTGWPAPQRPCSPDRRFDLHDPGWPRHRRLAVPPADAVSLSQISRCGIAPSDMNSFQIPANRSPVIRDGISRAMMNRDCEETITSPGNTLAFPALTGIRTSGSQRSHWTTPTSPRIQPTRLSASASPSAAVNGRRRVPAPRAAGVRARIPETTVEPPARPAIVNALISQDTRKARRARDRLSGPASSFS